jgi:hypothetical protein
MKVSILGTGKMGSAVGRKLAAAGYQVVFGSRNPEQNASRFTDLPNIMVMSNADAADASNVILVAVPWTAALDLLNSLNSYVAGKVIVDMTNPLSPDISYLTVSGNDSAAEQLASHLQQARVVKAFNMITADNFPNSDFYGEPAQIMYCSDHDSAKDVARLLIEAAGYVPKDCGALSNARYVEGVAMLWIQLAFWEDKGTAWGIKIIDNSSSAVG